MELQAPMVGKPGQHAVKAIREMLDQSNGQSGLSGTNGKKHRHPAESKHEQWQVWKKTMSYEEVARKWNRTHPDSDDHVTKSAVKMALIRLKKPSGN